MLLGDNRRLARQAPNGGDQLVRQPLELLVDDPDEAVDPVQPAFPGHALYFRCGAAHALRSEETARRLQAVGAPGDPLGVAPGVRGAKDVEEFLDVGQEDVAHGNDVIRTQIGDETAEHRLVDPGSARAVAARRQATRSHGGQ